MKSLIKSFGLFCAVFLFCVSGLFAQEGFLRVTSVPEGAGIEVAGKSIGKTPLLTVLKPGEYVIKATLQGYAAHTENIKVLENEVTLLQITMDREVRGGIFQRVMGGTGNLSVITDWQNVDIYIDGNRVKEKPPVTIKDLSAGFHNVILVSGDYADSSRVFIQKGKTTVLKKNFEEDKKKTVSLMHTEKVQLSKAKAAELELKRQALPAKISIRLANPAAAEGQQESSVSLWGESDTIELAFNYRKSGETLWNLKELKSGTKKEDAFELEKGTYDIQFIATHFKEPKGILNIWLGAKKEKVKEYKESLKHEFKPDTQYIYTIVYDGKTDFSYKLEEVQLNTPLE